jgi:hypothetical protein
LFLPLPDVMSLLISNGIWNSKEEISFRQRLQERNRHLSHFHSIESWQSYIDLQTSRPSNHAPQDRRGKHGMTDEQLLRTHGSRQSLIQRPKTNWLYMKADYFYSEHNDLQVSSLPTTSPRCIWSAFDRNQVCKIEPNAAAIVITAIQHVFDSTYAFESS